MSLPIHDLAHHSQSMIYTIDQQSKFTYCNPRCLQLFGHKSEHTAIGGTYDVIRGKAAEMGEIFTQQDQTVFTRRKAEKILAFCRYSEDTWRLLLGEKSLMEGANGDSTSILGNFMVLDNPALLNLHQILSESEIASLIKGNAFQFTYLIREEYGAHDLTPKESMVLFYMLRGLSCRDIGAKLSRSGRTIEDHVERIKSKLGASSKKELLEKCLSENFLEIIPTDLLRKP